MNVKAPVSALPVVYMYEDAYKVKLWHIDGAWDMVKVNGGQYLPNHFPPVSWLAPLP